VKGAEPTVIEINNSKGNISISNDVFIALAGDAATNCFGVKGMALRSRTDGLVHLLRRESMGKGVHVTFDENGSVNIELHIIVENGVNIPVICDSIIGEVRYKVSAATGVPIGSVNVFVDSMTV